MAYKGPQVVVGPAVSTDNTVPRFDLTTGALIQGSSVVISDADAVSGITQLDVDNIQINGNTIASTDTNGNVVLAPDGTGVVSVTTAAIVPSGDRADSLGSATNSWDNVYADGLTFDDGTNVLSDYVATSSWTPTLSFGGATTGITYSGQTGSYSRIGPLVFVRLAIVLTSKGTATGDAVISGLPYTILSGNTTPLCSYWSLINLSANYYSMGPLFIAGGTTIRLDETGDNVVSQTLQETQFSNTTVIRANGFYFAA